MTDTLDDIVQTLQAYNKAYRKGLPLVSDAAYDRLVEKLRSLDPDHPFLHVVEPETFTGKKEIRHPVPMLSTDKAYTGKALERFVVRVSKAAQDLGVARVVYRVTPKLDGLAGRDDGQIFASRGNGEIGYEISSACKKGVSSSKFEHPRNMVVGIVSSDKLNEFAQKALEDKAVHFVPYRELPFWEGDSQTLLSQINPIVMHLAVQTD